MEATGRPIVHSQCYCADCQAGAGRLEALPSAPPVANSDGGTTYLVYRDDRIRVVVGKHLLSPIRLTENSPTSRYFASCCYSGMYLKFAPGHWTSAYEKRFTGDVPDLEMRYQLADLKDGETGADDVPGKKRFPVALFWRLMTSRVAMALGR